MIAQKSIRRNDFLAVLSIHLNVRRNELVSYTNFIRRQAGIYDIVALIDSSNAVGVSE